MLRSSSRLLAFHRMLSTLLLILLTAGAMAASGQNTDFHTRITDLLTSIHTAESQHFPAPQQGALWAELGVAYWNATQLAKAEEAYTNALRLLKPVPSAQSQYAQTLDDLASLYLAYGRVDDAANAAEHALAARQREGDPVQIAVSHIHLANIALVRHQFPQAEKLTMQGMQTLQSVANPPTVATLSGFITLTYARCAAKRAGEGLLNAQQAMQYAGENFEPHSSPLGFAQETLGFAQWKTGDKQEGEKNMVQALEILRETLSPVDPRLSGAMLQYRAYLVESHRSAEARTIDQQVATMTRAAGIGCVNCEVSVNTLARTLR
jgi:tetratricopeptide (TPR) repeat protein